MAVGGFVQFFHLLAHASNPDIDPTTKAAINASLKNLMFFTHQNLLIVIQILLSRMVVGPQDSTSLSVPNGSKKFSNYWANNLQQITTTKMIKKLKTKGEAIQLLKVHMQNSENIMRNIIKS
jgi:hypothetical protein